MKISLTDREADVMQVLWDFGPSVVTDVQTVSRKITALREMTSDKSSGHC
jgi:predicted transcriptional regulator